MKTWYLLWITLQAVLVDAQIPVVESITIASDLSTARECVSWCAGYSSFGCSVNSCYCAPYIRSSINSFLSTCVTGSCPDSSDVEAATSAVSSYCDNYYAAVGATPAAIPTSAIRESITITDDLSTARECVSWCAAYSNFGCSVNSCYCAPYIRSSINSFISDCVTGDCPDSSDIEAATNAVSSYCNNYYAAVGSTPTAVPTSAIQDTSINVLPGATPTSAPSASATSSPGSTSSTGSDPPKSPISNAIKIVGIVVGGVIALCGGLLFCFGAYKSCTLRREERRILLRRQHSPSGQTGSAPRASTRKRLLLVAAIVGALATIVGTIATIYFGVKQRS